MNYQGLNKTNMKILQNICFILLLSTFSSAYAGSCFKAPYDDAADCRMKAKQGDAQAQFNLGFMYDNEKGVLQDYKEAVRWYTKSAEQGDAIAQNKLGLMHVKGQGVPKDYVMAHMYWNIAAVSGIEDAIKNRGTVEKQMTSSQLAEAQKLAREWMSKHLVHWVLDSIASKSMFG